MAKKIIINKTKKKENVAKPTKKKSKVISIKIEQPKPDYKKAQKNILKFVNNTNLGEISEAVFNISKKYHVPQTTLNKILSSAKTEAKKKLSVKQKQKEEEKKAEAKRIKGQERSEKKAQEETEKEAKKKQKEKKAQEKNAEQEANKQLKELNIKELEKNYKDCAWELFEQVFNDNAKISMKYLTKRILYLNTHITPKNKKVQGFKTFKDNGEIIRYNKVTGIYEENQDIYIAKLIQDYLGEMAVDYVIKEVTNKIRRSTYIEREFLLEQPKHLKPVLNGLYNLNENKLEAFNPEYIFLGRTAIMYNPKANYTKFLEFLTQVLETEKDVKAMQEWLGYMLLNDCRFQKACLLFGSGANGKSVLLKIIKRFLGNAYVVSIALQYLETNNFALARLFGKSANIFFDLPKKALDQTSNFKMIVAGDSVSGEKKGKDSFEFTPFCKQMFSCNEVPRTPDTTLAFFRRWLIFKFSETFDEGNPKRIDNLEEQFYTKEEMEGILLFAIQGLKRLLKNKQFTENMSRTGIEEFWIKHSDSVMSFIMDLVEVDPTAETTKQMFFDRYEEYCKNKEYVVEDYKVFFKRLKDKIEYEETRTKSEFGQHRRRMIKGIKIREVTKG